MDPQEGIIPSHLLPLPVSLSLLPAVFSAVSKLTFDYETQRAGPLKTQISLSAKDKRPTNSALNKKQANTHNLSLLLTFCLFFFTGY